MQATVTVLAFVAALAAASPISTSQNTIDLSEADNHDAPDRESLHSDAKKALDILSKPHLPVIPPDLEIPQNISSEAAHFCQALEDGEQLSKRAEPAVEFETHPCPINKGWLWILNAMWWPGDVCITVINGTPYRWRRGFQNAYQLKGWAKRWPETIQPGQSLPVQVNQGGWHGPDSAGEVEYHLEGTSRPMGVRIEFRSGGQHESWVRLLDDLEAPGHPPKSEIQLPVVQHIPGSAYFILAGKEGEFITSDPPAGWMQSELKYIGDMPLRDVVVGRSHHAGMWKEVDPEWFARSGVTMCQTEELYDQLRYGGVRVLDVRVADRWGIPHAGHGQTALRLWNGMIGASITEMVGAVNQFNRDYPGELIIWDIHHAGHVNPKNPAGARKLNEKERKAYYKDLLLLDNRVRFNETTLAKDIGSLPLNYFIGNGSSAVIVRGRMEDGDGDIDHGWPGEKEGFILEDQYKVHERWSNTNKHCKLVEDQLGHLEKDRKDNRSKWGYDLQWLLSLIGIDNIAPPFTILEGSQRAWRRLHHDLWNALTDKSHPTWITMDGIKGHDFKTFVVAVNRCFVAGSCGDWAGKPRKSLLTEP